MTTTKGTRTGTRFTTSADGTEIAYDATGTGPALVIVEGALCQRTMGTAKVLTEALASDYTVYAYDRRGRGESGPGVSPYESRREVEDLAAVIAAATDDTGEAPYVLGASSGGALTLEAARQGVPMRALAVYEAPFIVDDTHAPNDLDLPNRMQSLIDDDRRGEAVKLFLRTVGAPAPMIALMPLFPVWKQLRGVAHTLPYDLSIVIGFEQGKPLPAGQYTGIEAPAIVIAGGKSPAYLHNAQAAIADQLPNGRLIVLPGQTHMVRAKATAPVLREHFS